MTKPEQPPRPLVSNPLAHVILGALKNPENLGPMVKDALKQTSGVLLEELGIRLQKPPEESDKP